MAENLGLIGFGAIVAAVIGFLGTFFTKRFEAKENQKQWLRDKRLAAFSTLSRSIVSFRKTSPEGKLELIEQGDDMAYLASESLLLIDDKDIRKSLYEFIDKYQDLMRYASKLLAEEKHSGKKSSSADIRKGQKLLEETDRLGKLIVEKLAVYVTE